MLIVAIEPRAPGLHIFTQAYTPRIGLPRLLTQAQNLGHSCFIFCEELRSSQIDWGYVACADVVMISSTTSTAPRSYQLARQIRKMNPRVPILGGGPHFTFECQEALDNGIDYVFRHWADRSFFQWLGWFQSLTEPGRLSADDLISLSQIGGLAFKIGSQMHKTGMPEQVHPDTWPTPDLGLIRGYKPRFITLITSEGCDHNCEFCSEWAMHGARYRSRSPEKVMRDIAYYRRVYGNVPIFFGDDNIAADLKNDDGLVIAFGHDRLRNLCQMIIDWGLEGVYSGQVRLALADHPEVLEVMTMAGFDRVYIGYESINPDNAKATGGKLDFSRMEEQTANFHKCGISVHAMWVLGFDHDTLDTVKRTVQAAIRWRIDTNQFLVLMPLPGSPLRTRLKREGRIIHNDWEKYDGHHTVFFPKLMKPWELHAAVMLEAMPKGYNLWQTADIYLVSNWRTFRRWLAHKAPHPKVEFKSHIVTLVLRVVGLNVVMRAKKEARDYLKQLQELRIVR
ncbi:B12-binding domain-containing radical SAM protein [Patescibacteria group bacterium]|nr:B12-binding domain-containing radical SAM protein [Patescibacteria group bacterium]